MQDAARAVDERGPDVVGVGLHPLRERRVLADGRVVGEAGAVERPHRSLRPGHEPAARHPVPRRAATRRRRRRVGRDRRRTATRRSAATNAARAGTARAWSAAWSGRPGAQVVSDQPGPSHPSASHEPASGRGTGAPTSCEPAHQRVLHRVGHADQAAVVGHAQDGRAVRRGLDPPGIAGEAVADRLEHRPRRRGRGSPGCVGQRPRRARRYRTGMPVRSVPSLDQAASARRRGRAGRPRPGPRRHRRPPRPAAAVGPRAGLRDAVPDHPRAAGLAAFGRGGDGVACWRRPGSRHPRPSGRPARRGSWRPG